MDIELQETGNQWLILLNVGNIFISHRYGCIFSISLNIIGRFIPYPLHYSQAFMKLMNCPNFPKSVGHMSC